MKSQKVERNVSWIASRRQSQKLSMLNSKKKLDFNCLRFYLNTNQRRKSITFVQTSQLEQSLMKSIKIKSKKWILPKTYRIFNPTVAAIAQTQTK